MGTVEDLTAPWGSAQSSPNPPNADTLEGRKAEYQCNMSLIPHKQRKTLFVAEHNATFDA